MTDRAHPSSDFARQMRNYRLTTAEILYHMPDHPRFLQTYVWQELDLAPRFPELKRFLEFWETTLDGKLYRVRVASAALIKPAEMAFVRGEFTLN